MLNQIETDRGEWRGLMRRAFLITCAAAGGGPLLGDNLP